jgi:hypothetical protein
MSAIFRGAVSCRARQFPGLAKLPHLGEPELFQPNQVMLATPGEKLAFEKGPLLM